MLGNMTFLGLSLRLFISVCPFLVASVFSQPITYQNLSLDGLRKEMAFIAGQIQEYEAKVSSVESEIQALSKKILETQLMKRNQNDVISTCIESVVRLSQTSPLIAFVMEKDANDFVRSGLLMQSLMPALKKNSDGLTMQADHLKEMQDQMALKRKELEEASVGLISKKSILSKLYAQRAQQLGDQPKVDFDKELLMASSMEQLLNFVKLRKNAKSEMNKALAQLTIIPPVQGKLLALHDVAKKITPHCNGAIIETRSGAQVIAPTSGQVVFSGPFREFGNLLILRAQSNYHVVLMGLGKIDVAVGQELMSGEPIGEMASGEGKVMLGLELRNNTHIIDPTPWVMKWNQ